MTLSAYKVRTSIAVSSIARAAEFYAGKLGLSFERYDDPVLWTDEKGIHELDDGKVAWFMDPDGNTFAIEQIAGERDGGER